MADKDDDMTNSTLPKMNLLDEFWAAWKNGAGMFLEAYVTFAIGNIGSIFHLLYPTCFGKTVAGVGGLECNPQIPNAIPTVEIAAIIVGMLVFGLLGDHMGRLTGLRSTISLYVVGILGLTVAFGMNLSGQFAMFLVFVIIYCLGVGGEYPMASASASERSEAYQLARGRTVTLTFANQGWGNFINTGIICILLAITQTGGCSATTLSKVYNGSLIGVCDEAGLQVVWRVQYVLCLPIILWLWYLRFCVFRETEVWKQRQEAKFKNESPVELRATRWKHTKMLFGRKYIGPLTGCAVGWFVWDIAFYGNKLFQGTIMQAVVGQNANNETLYLILLYTLLTSFISLIGYYFAAFTMDTKWMGRVRMQVMGFVVTSIISLVCGFDYGPISGNSQLFLFLYLVQSFFGQWGPNCTTYLLPVELFPTDVRGQAHGISSASGKFGALVATLIFSYGANGGPVSAQIIFIVTGFACLVGVLVTIIFVRDVTGVPLKQIDRRWSVDFAEAYGGSPNKVGAVEAHDEADKN